MPIITLHDCKRLNARITLAACEANRAKRDIMQAQCEWKEPGVRPWACRDCTDWQGWNTENTPEVTMSNPEPEIPAPACTDAPVCAECGGSTRPFARGLCKKCYQRLNRREKKAQQESVPTPVVPVTQSAPVENSAAHLSVDTARRVYLACPYTSADAAVMAQRLASATTAANVLIRQGYNVFSPISHGAEVGKGLPPEFAFWRTSCLSFVEHWATDVYVLMLPGWESSVGVSAEVEAATARNIPITHILPLAV